MERVRCSKPSPIVEAKCAQDSYVAVWHSTPRGWRKAQSEFVRSFSTRRASEFTRRLKQRIERKGGWAKHGAR